MSQDNPHMDQRVRKIIRLMKEDLGRRLTPHDMARAVNLSPEHLRYLFKADTGLSPSQYLRALRMNEAESLLKTTFLSVKEIVHKLCLGDESHFTRAFKKAYGTTPAQYRARHLNKEV